MSLITARFTQSPNENKRYMADFTLDLAAGEQITGVATPTVTAAQNQTDSAAPTLVVTNVTIGPEGQVFTFFVSGGVANGYYEVDFLATTSIGQVLETCIAFTIRSDV